MAEVEETLDRISKHRGVEAVLIVNAEGLPIRPPRGRAVEGSSADVSQKYAANLSSLAAKARSVVRDLDPTNDLTFLRIRTKKNEIMVAPDKDFLLIVVQDPTVSSKPK